MKQVHRVVCWLRGHQWQIAPYPSLDKSERYDALPYLIDRANALTAGMEHEECVRCSAWRWRFVNAEAQRKYDMALDRLYRMMPWA